MLDRISAYLIKIPLEAAHDSANKNDRRWKAAKEWLLGKCPVCYEAISSLLLV
jgi:hypothetical protein